MFNFYELDEEKIINLIFLHQKENFYLEKNGKTLAYYAAEKNMVNVLKLLDSFHFDISRKCSKGKPLTIAIMNKNKESALELLKHEKELGDVMDSLIKEDSEKLEYLFLDSSLEKSMVLL